MEGEFWRIALQPLLSNERGVTATGHYDSCHPLPRTVAAVGELGFVWLLAGLVRGSCAKAQEGRTRTELPEVPALVESHSTKALVGQGRGSGTGSYTPPPHKCREGVNLPQRANLSRAPAA